MGVWGNGQLACCLQSTGVRVRTGVGRRADLKREEALELRAHEEQDALERAVEEHGAHEQYGEQQVRRGGCHVHHLRASERTNSVTY